MKSALRKCLPLLFPAVVFAVFFATAWRGLVFSGLLPADGNLLILTYPLRENVKAALFSGAPPLWNPLQNMGEPLLADPQSMSLYPPFLFGLLLSFAGFMKFWILFHSALAFYFLYRVAHRLGGGMVSAAACAAFFVFNPLVLSKGTLGVCFASLAWYPVCAWFYLEGSASALGLAFALLWLAGYPSYSVMAAAIFAAAAIFSGRDKTVFLLKSALLALALDAAQTLPFLEMLSRSARGVLLDKSAATVYSSTPAGLGMQLFVPPWVKTPDFGGADPGILAFYAGITALSLAVYAAVKNGKAERAAVFLCAVLLTLALGPATPLYAALPFTNVFRFPAYWLLPALLIIALLCARGLAKVEKPALRLSLAALLAADIFAAGFARSTFAWVKPAYFTDTPRLARDFARDYGGARIYHTVDFQKAVSARALGSERDYVFIKEALLPSHGTAFGVAEARSYQVLRSKSCADYLLDMETRPQARAKLLDDAGIALVMDAKQSGGKIEFLRFENKTARPLVYFDGGSPPPRYEPGRNSVRVESETDRPQLLVMRQVYYPGWKALIDGKTAPLETYNGIFSAVRVPSGKHEVVFRYRPLSFFAGAALSLCALLFIAIRFLSEFYFASERRACSISAAKAGFLSSRG